MRMSFNINRISVSLFILLCLLVSGSVEAYNYHESHGENFSYVDDSDTHTIFPVIWDLRSAYNQLSDYYVSYGWSVTSARTAVDSLMEEAWSYGVNSVMLRNEIADLPLDSLRAGPSSSNTFVILADDFRTDSLHGMLPESWTTRGVSNT
jgi:hypothetical protein